MKKVFTLLLICSICLSFSHCRKCTQNQVANLQFTQEELKINPYNGSEILIFKSIDGDTVVFPAGVRGTEVRTVPEHDASSADADYHGCQGDYFYVQINWLEKASKDFNIGLHMELKFLYTFNNPTYDKEFWLMFWIDTKSSYSNYGFWGQYKFNFDTLYNVPRSQGRVLVFLN